LFASSSAAIILPVVDAQQLAGPAVLQLLPQVALADAACIVALPLVIDPTHAGRAAVGAVVVLAAAGLAFVVLRVSERRGWRLLAHRKSERRGFALELRISLLMLLLLAALAQQVHVSIMLAGFSLGLAVAAIGPPRRLARQLFGVSEGLFAPLFFIWLGASLDLRELGQHPSMILLGVVLAAAACSVHAVTALTGAPIPVAVLGAAQLGVPVAAATLGAQLQLLRPGEAAALLLGALLTIAAASAAARAWSARTASPPPDGGPLSTDGNYQPKPVPGSAAG
jgi:Kef-type K+ transport system membrane component KefB